VAAQVPAPPPTRVRGRVIATRVADAPGPLLAAAFCSDRLCWLARGPRGLVREDGAVVAPGALGRDGRIRMRPGATWMAAAGRLLELRAGKPPRETALDALAGPAAFDANERHVYWLADGALWRDESTGPARIGEVARGQSALWVGPRFGFGFYRAGEMTVSFVFDARARGLNDGVRVPRLPGQLVWADAFFSERLCWFATETRERGRAVRRLCVVTADGSVEAAASSEDGEAAWWEGLAGACAAGAHLFVPTDEGIVRLTLDGGVIRQSAEFPDTEPFVSGARRLLSGPGGLHVIAGTEILRLEIR
ncbi:MAG TPA: hypothetical protein VMK65_03755, partial [Longimicrobiales bacterium]|nr:hypothetical protein [Longimicrobiales bacterium]